MGLRNRLQTDPYIKIGEKKSRETEREKERKTNLAMKSNE